MAEIQGHFVVQALCKAGEALRYGVQGQRSFRPNGQSSRPFGPWQRGR